MKRCGHCHEFKPLSEFPKRSSQKDGYNYNCRTCSLQQGKESKYRYRYGITLQDKEQMLDKQLGKCAVCGEVIEGRICVDHDHRTNKVRGILCNGCNVGLGAFEDNVEKMALGIAYLEKWQNKT